MYLGTRRHASQRLTVFSSEADATTLPFGDKTTEVTQPNWHWSVWSLAPLVTSQSLTVLSHEAAATKLSSGEKCDSVEMALQRGQCCVPTLPYLRFNLKLLRNIVVKCCQNNTVSWSKDDR